MTWLKRLLHPGRAAWYWRSEYERRVHALEVHIVDLEDRFREHRHDG